MTSNDCLKILNRQGVDTMKQYTAAAMAILLSASLASAGTIQKSTTAPAKLKTHVVAAEIVKSDATAKTITVKDDKGAEMTMPCEGKCVAELKTFKAGEKVKLTCKDNDKGEHQAVVNVRAIVAPAAAKIAKK
jgi:Cu/Ag efflux protein CusF